MSCSGWWEPSICSCITSLTCNVACDGGPVTEEYLITVWEGDFSLVFGDWIKFQGLPRFVYVYIVDHLCPHLGQQWTLFVSVTWSGVMTTGMRGSCGLLFSLAIGSCFLYLIYQNRFRKGNLHRAAHLARNNPHRVVHPNNNTAQAGSCRCAWWSPMHEMHRSSRSCHNMPLVVKMVHDISYTLTV